MLLPPDLRDWIASDDPVHFIIEAVQQTPTEAFRVNGRGSGSAQYPPAMVLALLVYCYSMGIFSSRRIERATYRDVSVRFLTGDTHPDHDTIATFRRQNGAAISACFKQVLLLARELGLAKVGTVSVDGSHFRANASKFKNVSYERAGELVDQLDGEIKALLEKADQADHQDKGEDSLPEELQRLEQLREKLRLARERMKQRAEEQAKAREEELEEAHQQKKAQGKKTFRKKKATDAMGDSGDKTPPKSRDNLTDTDSRLMRKDERASYEQCYNAQAVVDADGSQLVLSARVIQSSIDHGELVADIDAIPKELGTPRNVLADGGYASESEVKALEARSMKLYVNVCAEAPRKHDFRPAGGEPKQPSPTAESAFGKRMIALLQTDTGKALYALRKQSVEPVFGILKKNLGFRQFNLRGLAKVTLEWELLTLSYNIKRIWNMKMAKAPA